MLSKDLELALNQAFKVARDKRHEFVTVEHLLLSLIDNGVVVDILTACGVNLNALCDELATFVDTTTPVISKDDTSRDAQPTLGFQRVLQRAVFHVQSSGKAEVTGASVLVAIYGEQESHAVYLLNQQNVARLDVVNYIAHAMSNVSNHMHQPPHYEESLYANGGHLAADELEKSAIERFTINLNEQAVAGKIDPLIGRSQEMERVLQTLARRRKNNPLLVGESGVGKTAIAEGLAKRITEGGVPNHMQDTVVYALDLAALLAGTKYRGDFEKRFKDLLNDLNNHPGSILFIDEIHTVIGAGATTGSVMDASNLLKPLLSSGQCRCMGSTTFEEYRSIFAKDHALNRRFQKIDIDEPSVDDTYKILQGLKSRFEEHHHLRYTNQALLAAAQLSNRYMSDRFMPDKAIDVIDEAGASQSLRADGKRKKTINVLDIEKIVANIARIPSKAVSSSDRKTLQKLEDELKRVVFGQDEAISLLAAAIKMARAGLKSPEKPIGSFLFMGPTGVGKTEVAKQLAMLLGLELIRFDMSEYKEQHTISRLIGAPPGYVGHDKGGLLTEAVTKHPHSVVLLDEIEKAHSDIFNLLLQVMDHGTLTDNNGRKADFRHVTVIMTTNAGAQSVSRRSMGFTEQDHSTDGMEEIKHLFTPEFRNRLDAIMPFKPLSKSIVLTVVDKFLVELQHQLDDKRVMLDVDQTARDYLVEKGYDKLMGARPMAKLIQDAIKKPLADKILFGDLSVGGRVTVTVRENELVCLEEAHLVA